MKKNIQAFAIIIFLGVSLRVFATAPCHTAFAVDMAFVAQEYAEDLAGCAEMVVMTGPCKDEAALKYAYNTNIALNDWSKCCCTYGLTCCGG
ncbi:MAG: hypothetical protein JNJ90_20430 [Saprospiraceae bacterium]|jgi:hypothetical protein|nr:hypothetical protein [Saprospiraceae bacterium]